MEVFCVFPEVSAATGAALVVTSSFVSDAAVFPDPVWLEQPDNSPAAMIAAIQKETALFLMIVLQILCKIYSESGHPFTAPENIPLISCFCPKINMEIDGMIIITTPAIIMDMDWESTLSNIPIPI